MMAYYDANGVKLGDERRGDRFYDANGEPVVKNNGPMFRPRWIPPVLTEEEARDIRNGARMCEWEFLPFEPTGHLRPSDPIGSFDEE